ncbi:MAG: SRPBCC family protein [Paracoccaceae bacterium]|nr:SRPBCC family protein [Paracoccaceae bacterium]
MDNTITVDAPLDEVWALLEDVEAVASCVPGAAAERTGDDEYAVTMTTRLGPMHLSYDGSLIIAEKDRDNLRVTFKADGKDKKGQGTATSVTEAQLTAEGAATSVTMTTDLQMTGRIAQMGRGLVRPVAAEIVNQTSANLAQMIQTRSAEGDAGQTVPGSDDMHLASPHAAPQNNALNLWQFLWALIARFFQRRVR